MLDQQMLSPEECSRVSGRKIHANTFRRAIARGDLPAKPKGGGKHLLVRVPDVVAFLLKRGIDIRDQVAASAELPVPPTADTATITAAKGVIQIDLGDFEITLKNRRAA
jgi:hypothetical protein